MSVVHKFVFFLYLLPTPVAMALLMLCVFSGTGTAQLLDQEKREVDMILGDVSSCV